MHGLALKQPSICSDVDTHRACTRAGQQGLPDPHPGTQGKHVEFSEAVLGSATVSKGMGSLLTLGTCMAHPPRCSLPSHACVVGGLGLLLKDHE